MTMQNDQRSFPELLTDLVQQLTTLLRKEAQLARSELSDKINQVAGATGLLGAGLALLIAGLVVLLQAAVSGLIMLGLEPIWATLAVGAAVVLIGVLMLVGGIGRLRASSLAPSRTIEQLQRDAAVAKEQIR